MRKLKLTLSLIALSTQLIFAGIKDTVVPENNKKVIEYVNSQIGKKVKTGKCFDLVDAALISVDQNWRDKHSTETKIVYGKTIKSKNVKPGDIIHYSNTVINYSDGSIGEARSHVGVVIEVIGEGIFKTAEQNVNCKSLKESKVVIKELDLSTVQKGKIEFYRF